MCYIKKNVLQKLLYVMCVIAHDERFVGCASLCPLIPIIHFCGGLAVKMFSSSDKGMYTVLYMAIQYLNLLYFCVWPQKQ